MHAQSVEVSTAMKDNQDIESPIEIDLSESGSKLYIFFGGIIAGVGIPPFEFYRSSEILKEHRIFVRDLSQRWYQNGLPPLTHDIFDTATHLENELKRISPEEVFFVGNSMGGYAAILFSSLIGVGKVIAFSPQTFISPWLRYRHKDYRWGKQIRQTYFKSFFKKKIWNLRSLLLNSYTPREIALFVSNSHRLDCIHADHIADIEGVKIEKIHQGGHNVVKILRDRGELHSIMSGDYT